MQWGDSGRIGITKANLNNIIKEYVQTNYPKKVELYHQQLRDDKLSKINKYSNVILLVGDLMWQDDENTINLKLSTLEAKMYCKKLHLATKNDWRVPTYSELLTLVDYFRYEPSSIDELKNIHINRYWTSTEDAVDISATWYVDFTYGQTGSALRYLKYNVRCVRDVLQEEGTF